MMFNVKRQYITAERRLQGIPVGTMPNRGVFWQGKAYRGAVGVLRAGRSAVHPVNHRLHGLLGIITVPVCGEQQSPTAAEPGSSLNQSHIKALVSCKQEWNILLVPECIL